MLTPRQVIDQAKKNLEVKTHGDLAYELRKRGLQSVDASTISRWVTKNPPRWQVTMMLLEIGEWLSPEARQASEQVAATVAESEAALKRAATGVSRRGGKAGRQGN